MEHHSFELMRRISEEMERAFESVGLSRGWGFGGETTGWSPTVEDFERDNNPVACADLPGLNKDDVKVEMADGGLLIQGERKREHEDNGIIHSAATVRAQLRPVLPRDPAARRRERRTGQGAVRKRCAGGRGAHS
jgi:HSP20 family molecular chaperone IbpA